MIQETLARTVQVEADSREDAEDAVRKSYRNCDIVLDSGDYVETEFLVERVSYPEKSRHKKTHCYINYLNCLKKNEG